MGFVDQFVIGPFVYIFDAFIARTKLMGTIEDNIQLVGELSNTLDTIKTGVAEINTDLDAVAAKIAELKVGQVSQEQIDTLTLAMENLKAKASGVSNDVTQVAAEAEGLKG